MAGVDVRWLRNLGTRPGACTGRTPTPVAREAAKSLDLFRRPALSDPAGMGRGGNRSRRARRLHRPQAYAHALDSLLRALCRADRALLGLLVPSDLSLLHRNRFR